MPKRKPKNKSTKLGSSIQADFVSLASHQLRTPLSAIRWLLDLLVEPRNGKLNKKQREYINKLYVSNDRMIALVNDLLEVTRIDQGQYKMYLRATDLVTIIRGLIKEKEKVIKEKKLQITFTTEQEPFPYVKTDSIRIKQAIYNIFSNAILYTPEGGGIHIDLQTKGRDILCKIQDTGVGIPKREQKNIFTKFFRGSNIMKYESVGTGLGMYITKKIITASGGKIWFESAENKGTTYYFTLHQIKK